VTDDPRASPWVRNAILLVGFLVLVAVGIFTVVLPELEEAQDPERPAAMPETIPEAASEP
jgi:hypothetical protein